MNLKFYPVHCFFTLFFGLLADAVPAQERSNHGFAFEQLGTVLPSPNDYRTADGSPGPAYWQQRCDYDITCTLDVENQRLSGEELITYHNQSPHTLTYPLAATR